MGNGILVLADHDGQVFKKTTYELLGKAREIASGIGADITALVLGTGDAGDLGAHGAARVLTVDGDAFSTYTTGAVTKALQVAIEATGASVVLASASPATKDCMPRLAARLGAGLCTEATDLRLEDGAVVGRRPQYAGKAFSDVRISSDVAIFTVRPNSFPVGDAVGGSASAEALAVELGDADQTTSVVGVEQPEAEAVDLTEADRIVSGGRSLKSEEGFDSVIRPLAAAVGATAGASRAAVDAGYASHSDQVGQTGKTVNPSLYIACGISGAIQHLAGMRTSRVIVAINKDPDAPIFQHATYGIVDDLFDVCPLLVEEFKQALS